MDGAAPVILALDFATRCGWAVGVPGAVPESGAVRLKDRDDPQEATFSAYMEWLDRMMRAQRPKLIAFERPLALSGFAKASNNEAAVLVAYGLRAITLGTAHRWGVPAVSDHPATIRRHFLGAGAPRSRKAAKPAVIQRARLLKYIPADCADEDRADACAVFDYAAALHGKARPASLHLFGEAAA